MQSLPVALTIAGSDSGGGAGIQADLKTFAALGVHGTSVVTCLTAQNPKTVSGISAVEPVFVRQQLEAVFSELPPLALKTGMLYSAEIIELLSEFFSRRKHPQPLVVDPVMVSTSGKMLLQPKGVEALKRLAANAMVITPNLDELSALLGKRMISTTEQLRSAARELQGEIGCAVLVKGGHLRTKNEAIDFFYDGKTELMLSAPRIRCVKTHGTGCTYSAAITAGLAKGMNLQRAVTAAKDFVTNAIARSRRIGKGHQALGWL